MGAQGQVESHGRYAHATFVRGVTWRARALDQGLRHTVRPVCDLWARLPFDLFPPNLVDHVARVLPLHTGTAWRPVDLPRCGSEWLRAVGVGELNRIDDTPVTDRAILYLHGGAFLTCGLNTHRRLVSRLSFATKQPVLSVGYRQMPETSIRGAVDDCLDGLRWLLAQGYPIENITIAGDSAGGYLAFATARAALDAGLGRAAGVVAISPLLELDPTAKAAHRNADRCPTFSLEAISHLTAVIDALEERRGLPRRGPCPVDMPLTGLPPALIHVGSEEILRADAERMTARLVAAGVPCDLTVWDRQVHVFQAAASWLPEARAAIDQIGAFIRDLEHRAREQRDFVHPSARGPRRLRAVPPTAAAG